MLSDPLCRLPRISSLLTIYYVTKMGLAIIRRLLQHVLLYPLSFRLSDGQFAPLFPQGDEDLRRGYHPFAPQTGHSTPQLSLRWNNLPGQGSRGIIRQHQMVRTCPRGRADRLTQNQLIISKKLQVKTRLVCKLSQGFSCREIPRMGPSGLKAYA